MEKDYIQNIDQIRQKEYPLLDNTTYLDHAGTTLYSKSLVEQFSKDLIFNLFGNPHSASPSSALSTERTEHVRSRVLEFFKADPEHFDVVFVANATAAIKLVMQAFQDGGSRLTTQKQPGFWYGYHSDAHTSLVGVRQVAYGGSRCFRSDEEVEHWLQGKPDPAKDGYGRPNDSQLALFAYPAQSNMNGHRLPLSWAGRVRSSSHAMHTNMYTMLDAAAYVSTAQLDLSDTDKAPDFTALSFYKIFGFPDLGALIVRKAAAHILQQRRYFGGGTVEMVIAVDTAWHAKKEHEIHDEAEDGTLPFHSIIALDSALDTHQRLFGSMVRISAHACYLAKVLYEGLRRLHHGNGLSLCEIYKHAGSTYGDSTTQAPTIAFNVRNSQGGWIGKSDFEQLAIVRGIQLRTGGVCNPGGIATCLALKPWELRRMFAEGMRCGNEFDILGGKPTGIVRVSLGAMTNMKDIETFLRFVREVFVEEMPAPAPASERIAQTDEEDRVQSITLYPLRDGKGWQVPRDTPWEIKDTGLAWDREWCLVSKIDGETLSAEDHPRLRLLESSLHVEEGFLKISIPATLAVQSKSTREISVSIWDSPPANPERSKTTNASPLADSYTSPALADFFTSFMGFPCTLGRYQDHRLDISRQIQQQSANNRRGSITQARQPAMRANEQPRRASSLTVDLPLERSFTICTSPDANDSSNIRTASFSSSKPGWQYIQIGSHYFRSLSNPSQPYRHLRHLPNLFDLSAGSQNPTIRAGDVVQTFSANYSAENPGLRACIASSFAPDFICPVPACRKECTTKEEKSEHLLVHRTGKVGTNATAASGSGSKSKMWPGPRKAFLLATVTESGAGRSPSNERQDGEGKKRGWSPMRRKKQGENNGDDSKTVKSKTSFGVHSIFNKRQVSTTS